MKLIHDSASCLLHLLLLAELFVHSSSHPASSLCGMFRSMSSQMDVLTSKKLHDLTNDELRNFDGAENKLNDLPHIEHTANHLSSIKVNESLSQLYVYTQSFMLHVNWLKTAKENVSLSSESAEDTSAQLLQLSNLIDASLQRISEEVPQPPSASLPVVSTAFEVLQFSVEISERLKVFCIWSKRVLRHLRTHSGCPRH